MKLSYFNEFAHRRRGKLGAVPTTKILQFRRFHDSGAPHLLWLRKPGTH